MKRIAGNYFMLRVIFGAIALLECALVPHIYTKAQGFLITHSEMPWIGYVGFIGIVLLIPVIVAVSGLVVGLLWAMIPSAEQTHKEKLWDAFLFRWMRK